MVMADIRSIRNDLEQRKGKKIQLEQIVLRTEKDLKEKRKDLRRHEEAREVVREVGLKMQKSLQYHISEITTLALDAVFDSPYKLEAEFVQRRNKSECDLFFARDGNRVDPLEASGIGAVDVAAFALRVASWSMQSPRSRNVLILDEPFKHLKGEVANKRVLSMIKEISRKLDLQIIMVSDERISREQILESADKVFEVSLSKKGISEVRCEK
jgi:DNA repair exonuclease SbcCD ATPase subunit